jgi:hypothetical protein
VKPYLVHKTWVDLDHVLAICSEPAVMPVWHPLHHDSASVNVEMMFRSDRLSIFLGELPDVELAGNSAPGTAAKVIIAAFIAAWKTKDESPGPCQPSLGPC